jgi:hypothetical protein
MTSHAYMKRQRRRVPFQIVCKHWTGDPTEFRSALATIALTFVAPVMVRVALLFGPAEYFALMVLAFTTVTAVVGDSLARGFASLFFGPALARLWPFRRHGRGCRPRRPAGQRGLLRGCFCGVR